MIQTQKIDVLFLLILTAGSVSKITIGNFAKQAVALSGRFPDWTPPMTSVTMKIHTMRRIT
jgi:hypothetical protein